jgi:hypothetical protein
MAPIKKTTTKMTGEKVISKKEPAKKATAPAAPKAAAAKPETKVPAKKPVTVPKAAEKPKAPTKTAKTATVPVKKTATKAVSKTPAKAAAAPKKTATKAAAPAAKAPAKAAPAKASAPVKAVAPAKPATRKASAPAVIPATAPMNKSAMLEIEAQERELPLEYGDTKIVLLTRDPEWIFAYWEINPATRKKYDLVRGNHSKPISLRMHTLASRGHVAPYDVPVNDYTSSWYIRVPAGGSRFRVDLGVFDAKGTFVTLASSNEIEVPRMEIAESTDLEFAEINDEIYHQIVQLSGGLGIKERLGSDEFLRSLQQRVFDVLSAGPMSSAGLSSGAMFGLSSGAAFSGSVLSSGAFGLLSSGAFGLSSAGLFSAGAGGEGAVQLASKERRSDFWLEVGVDVIVYGATEPDAKVVFMGQEIRLTPDGTFRVRMVLPDTTIEFPIQAESADGEHHRAVKPVVKRHTEGDPRKPL